MKTTQIIKFLLIFSLIIFLPGYDPFRNLMEVTGSILLSISPFIKTVVEGFWLFFIIYLIVVLFGLNDFFKKKYRDVDIDINKKNQLDLEKKNKN
tara:strand:- start:136 stop:420 length:285 start_codon:yes stop_codon:yes gene_type:complete